MKKILNLGCGTGQNIPSLLGKGKIYCADMEKSSIEKLSRKYPDCIVQIGMAESLSYEDNFFDEVYAFDILEHVQDIDLVLQNIHRWMKKGATFSIEVPHDTSEQFLTKLNPEYPKQIGHMRVFTRDALLLLLQKHGFSTEKTGYSRGIVNIYLGLLFYFQIPLSDQMSTVTGRGKVFERILTTICIWFDKNIFNTFLKWIPLWIVTLPIGWVITQIFPKTLSITTTK